MKRLIVLGSALALLASVPLVGYAAYNDVTLSTATVFSINGVTLNVYNASAVVQSVTASSTTLNLTLLPGSAATVLAPGRNVLTQTGGTSYLTLSECDSLASQLQFTYPAGSGSAAVVIITPSTTTTCSGGGNGGSTIVATPSTQAVAMTAATASATAASTTVTAAPPIVPSPPAASSAITSGSPSAKVLFTRYLAYGSKGTDVRKLQALLIAKGYLNARAPTDFYGLLTIKAVKQLQKANGLPQPGVLGPKTRALLNNL